MTKQEIIQRIGEWRQQLTRIDVAKIEIIGRLDELERQLKAKEEEDNIWDFDVETPEEEKDKGNGSIGKEHKR